MNLRDPNMAASEVSNSTSAAPPSRPAIALVKPKGTPPDAQFSTAIPEVKPSKSPRSKRPASDMPEPKAMTPGAPILGDEGDQATERSQPSKLAPDRIHPPVAGDETTDCSQPTDCTSRRINPAKAGGKGAHRAIGTQVSDSPLANSSGESRGVNQSPDATQREIVDANHPGQAGRDAALRTLNPTPLARRHESLSDGQAIIETHEVCAVAGDSLGHTKDVSHFVLAGTIAHLSDGHSPPETQVLNAVAGDDGAHASTENQSRSSPVIAEITQLVRMRRRWHKAEKSLTLQGKALCRSWTNGDKDEANALYDRAADGKPDDPILAMALAPFLDAKARFETERGAIEKTLRKLARTLPVWKAWAEGVKGLGDLRLAVIVGECGDIGSYRNPSCFWKRMGLAVIGGQRQRRVTDAAEALEHGYNPERRAIAYVMSTELIKAQVRRVKDAPETALRPAIEDVDPVCASPDAPPSIAIGPYGQLYLDRKAYEAGREGITKAHANNRAGRYLAKRVLRDLYAAWRAAS